MKCFAVRPQLCNVGRVAPRVGAWIEIEIVCRYKAAYKVAPRVGAWIEMANGGINVVLVTSLPAWERGLK